MASQALTRKLKQITSLRKTMILGEKRKNSTNVSFLQISFNLNAVDLKLTFQ